MPAPHRTPRSIPLLAVLAITVAVATAGVAVARQSADPVVPAAPFGAGAVHTAVFVPTAPVAPVSPVIPVASVAPVAPVAPVATEPTSRALRLEHALTVVSTAAAASKPVVAATPSDGAASRSSAPAPKAKAEPKGSGATSTSASSLKGRNRMWFPAIGIRRSVSFFSCSSNAYPGNRVYRWGCAGRNNVYLFGHAHSVFKPLHDAYVRGRLKKGMTAYFADARGRVSTYKVIWWRITTPDRGGFAYASLSRPSMTLQTCVGARSQYRLIVRLVKVG
jgi:hypothetical protein